MKKYFVLLIIVLTLSLTGCIHRRAKQQGNVIRPTHVAQLHNGMSKEEVNTLMGTPLLENTFNSNRWDYVYTLKAYHRPLVSKRVSILFSNDRVVQIIKVNV